MKLKFNPVAWMAAILAIDGALLGSAEVTGILPTRVVGIMTLISVVLTIVLGVLTHGVVTPLARPRGANGEKLVPKWPAQTEERPG